MKKFAAIILICFYTISVAGIVVNKFYCCGELTSTSIAAASSELENCKMSLTMDDCCNKSSQTFKVKDQHLASGLVQASSSPIVCILHLFYPVSHAGTISYKQILSFNSHAPPVLSGIPIHTLNCTYRI